MSAPTELERERELSERLTRDFDDERRVRAGDDELVLRACIGALARPRASRYGRRTALLVALAATLVVASAAAATSLWFATRGARLRELTEPMPNAASSVARGVRSVASPARADHAPSAPVAPSSTAPEAEAPPVEPQAAPAATGPRPATVPVERTAASLFHDASAARRAGDLGRARALYTELQSSFSSSNEARVSRVSLGKLLLGAGHADEAERQFRSYLALGAGDLGEEALVGRADALGRLGRRDDERSVWQELLARYPSSVYAPRARQRLGALGASE